VHTCPPVAGDTAPDDTDAPAPGDTPGEVGPEPVDQQPRAVAPLAQVRVAVLGSPRPPDYHTAPGKPGLRERAMELLAYLVVNDGHASVDAVLEDLVPDATFAKGKQMLGSALYSLRQAMKDLGGDITGRGRAYVDRDGRTYLLHKDRLDVDLWRMREHYTRAKASRDPQQRIRHLRAALAAYNGPFADGEHWEWIDVYREAVRRDHIDIVIALAEQLAPDPRQALAVLTPAIAAHPTTELLYQHAMRALAALDDDASIKVLRRDLTRALEDIDAEPDADTRTLATNLLADIARRAHRPGRGERQ
jgi:DNA-binding SARP family transcriptional activator